MGLHATARNIYLAIKDTPASVTEVRDELASLSLAIATTDEGAQQVTSATVNGQTFTTASKMTKLDRHALLAQVVAMLDAEVTVSNNTTATFSAHGSS